MYIPAFNRVGDDEKIDRLIESYGFAILLTQENGALRASHLPFLLDRLEEGRRVLRSHMARANRQWQDFTPEKEVLVIFSGPHSYISPAWYEMQHTVPTWNYAAVHVYGIASVIDEAALRKIVLDTTTKYEAIRAEPWQMPLSASEIDTMLKAVVGFSIEVTRVEGKFKLGQNRSKEDQAGMVRGLLSSPEAMSRELGNFILAQGNSPQGTTSQAWP